MPLFSRSARTLIKQQPGEQRHIKVRQTLGMARDRPTPYGIEGGIDAWRGTGPRPTVNRAIKHKEIGD